MRRSRPRPGGGGLSRAAGRGGALRADVRAGGRGGAAACGPDGALGAQRAAGGEGDRAPGCRAAPGSSLGGRPRPRPRDPVSVPTRGPLQGSPFPPSAPSPQQARVGPDPVALRQPCPAPDPVPGGGSVLALGPVAQGPVPGSWPPRGSPLRSGSGHPRRPIWSPGPSTPGGRAPRPRSGHGGNPAPP